MTTNLVMVSIPNSRYPRTLRLQDLKGKHDSTFQIATEELLRTYLGKLAFLSDDEVAKVIGTLDVMNFQQVYEVDEQIYESTSADPARSVSRFRTPEGGWFSCRAIIDWISHMDRYTFNFSITPGVEAEYEFAIVPFEVKIHERSLIVRVDGETSSEQRLQDEATLLVGDLARSLSYQLSIGYVAEYKNRHVRRAKGQQSASMTIKFTIRPADFEDRELAAKQEREQAQPRIVDMASRAAADSDLRDVLQHWLRYENDPEGRLHPLYDNLQVAVRVYGARRKSAATALNISLAELDRLGNISNDETIVNGRHPGRSPGPHRVASVDARAASKRLTCSCVSFVLDLQLVHYRC